MPTTGPIDGTIIRLTFAGDKILHATTSTISGSSSTTELASKDISAGSGDFTETSIDKHSWTVSCEALKAGDDTVNAENRANYIDVFTAWKAKTAIAVTYGTGVVGDFDFSGTAYVTGWTDTAADGEKATFSFEMSGSGELSLDANA